MPKQSILTLKTWFETGDYPTQQQFWDWLDSFIHKDEGIEITDVNDLTEALASKAQKSVVDNMLPVLLNAGALSWTVPAETLIDKILLNDPAAITFSIGETEGGSELIKPVDFEAGRNLINIDDLYFENETTIYFTGVTINTVIKIFKR